MTIEIPKYKYVQDDQTIDLSTNKICTLIGGNGSGKSTILESIFANYNEKIISFSSGQNELFTKIYNNIKSSTFKKIQNIDTNLEEIKKYHFHYEYSRILVFVALSLKNGLVRKYLNENSYIDTLLSNTFLDIDFELPDYYLRVYAQAREKETMEPEYNSIIKTYIHKYIERIIENKINNEYDFDKAIKKRTIRLTANDLLSIFEEKDSWKIFTFISLTNNATTPIFDYKSTKLLIKNDLEFEQLSDGEYQLLSIYALIDLFDSENTIFLFDEVDSHLHYENINKLWDTLKSINGKLINTTHIADSIITQDIESIKNVENATINNDEEKIVDKILKRLTSITASKIYVFKIASKLTNIALVENYKDWFIFKELCKIKIPNIDNSLFDKVKYIECSSGYDTYQKKFADNKLLWYKNYKDNISGTENKIKNIFMICDKDNFLIDDINENLTIKQTEEIKNDLRGIGCTHLLSWKRREIENYLLSYTILEYYGKINDIQEKLPRTENLVVNNSNDRETLQNLEVKDIIQSMYCDNSGVDYDKLKQVIFRIPPNEISEDIVKMYEFIKSKVEDN